MMRTDRLSAHASGQIPSLSEFLLEKRDAHLTELDVVCMTSLQGDPSHKVDLTEGLRKYTLMQDLMQTFG